MAPQVKEPSFRFTGRHMAFIMIAFFAVVIGVNTLMAVLANTSWTGLVVQNSYVASQTFNADLAARRAQEALGWTSRMSIKAAQIVWRLSDGEGRPIRAANVTAAFFRPVSDDSDFTITLAPRGDGAFAAPVALAGGRWSVRLRAEAGLERPYEHVAQFVVPVGRVDK